MRYGKGARVVIIYVRATHAPYRRPSVQHVEGVRTVVEADHNALAFPKDSVLSHGHLEEVLQEGRGFVEVQRGGVSRAARAKRGAWKRKVSK